MKTEKSGKQRPCRELEASASVEAVFVIPFIFFLMLMLPVVIFRSYDRIKLAGDIRFALEEAREQRERTGDVSEEAIRERLNQSLGDGYFFCEIGRPGIVIGRDSITVSVTLRMRPLPGSGIGQTTVAEEITTENRELKMRMIDAGKELLEKVVK